jgi:hypothetical protein
MRIHEKEGASRFVSRTCILLITGMLVSAQQVSAENIFTSKGSVFLREVRLEPPDFSRMGEPGNNIPLYADTLEMYDIELEEEDGGNIYKEIAAYIIVAGVVGYMIYTLIKPEEEEESVPTGGKEPPIYPALSVSIPFNRSP